VWNSILAFAGSNMAVAALFVVGPARLLHDEGGVLEWGMVVAAISMGEVCGDLLALRFRPRRMLLAARVVELAQVPLLVCVALVAPLPWLLGCAVLWGIGITYPDSLWYTALQQHLPEESISRVSSYDFMGSLVLRPVGYSVAAFVASGGALVETLLGAAVLIVVTRGVGMLVPSVRNLRRLEVATP
jgi:MFS family permease